jgi:lysophospholipid hydrolase
MLFTIPTVISAFLFVLIVIYYYFKYGSNGQQKKRFRKRDKIMFYGRRFIRRLRKIKRKQLKKLTRISKPPIVWTGNANNNNKELPSRGYKTVALFPNSSEVPICSFSRELHHNLINENVILITSEKCQAQLGSEEFKDEQSLESWMEQQEDSHRIVLYQCDFGLTNWTRVCLNRAKCILVVALAQSEPHITSYEQKLYSQEPSAPIELVLLHKLDAKKPKHTNIWLSIRSWCPVHHIRCPQRVFVRKRCKIEDIYGSLAKTCPSADNDFSRLARYLSGNSIGLVLGGGGARGAAHLGIIKALHEANIPIDMIGGVSIGAFMGALWAQETDLTPVTQLARDWSFKMTSRLRQIVDLTYPITAMFTGAGFNRTIHEAFGDRQIEDLWIPYFTVTTDITSSAPRIHRHGSLWRYVRSSMSLSGYLPPLCDPIDGHLLLDGGYVNNLPADVMHNVMGAKTILAIDVGSQDETDLTNYGDTLNGWWLLWKRWYPFGEPVKVPSLPEIQSRLAYVSCVRQLEEVKKSDYCAYIRPPIDPYKTMQFNAFDRILEIGYEHGKLMFPDEKAVLQ